MHYTVLFEYTTRVYHTRLPASVTFFFNRKQLRLHYQVASILPPGHDTSHFARKALGEALPVARCLLRSLQ